MIKNNIVPLIKCNTLQDEWNKRIKIRMCQAAIAELNTKTMGMGKYAAWGAA